MVTCGPASERGTNHLHPRATARRTDDGWQIDGDKLFGTLSPAADVLGVTVRIETDEGPQLGLANMAADSEGVIALDDWDALGMRASGSQSFRFERCMVPDSAVTIVGPWGEWHETWFSLFLSGTYALVVAFHGIAETAHREILRRLDGATKGPSNRLLTSRVEVQRAVSDNVTDLITSQGVIERCGRVCDELYGQYVAEPVPTAEHHRVHAEVQAAKLIVMRRAIDVVDRSLTLSGGAGYMSSDPLSRLWRDVRAGPFMAPMSEHDAPTYIGQVALGEDPDYT